MKISASFSGDSAGRGRSRPARIGQYAQEKTQALESRIRKTFVRPNPRSESVRMLIGLKAPAETPPLPSRSSPACSIRTRIFSSVVSERWDAGGLDRGMLEGRRNFSVNHARHRARH